MMNKLSTALVAMSLVAWAQPALAQAGGKPVTGDKNLIKPSTTINRSEKKCGIDFSIAEKTYTEQEKRKAVSEYCNTHEQSLVPAEGGYVQGPEQGGYVELKRGPVLVTQPKPSKSNQAFIQMLKDKEAAKAAAAAKKPQ